MNYSVGIIIVSDRAFAGERDDKCMEVFEEILGEKFSITDKFIVNDDPDMIEKALQNFVRKNLRLIFTSGGTGCSPRDNTPEATLKTIDKQIPGLGEAIRKFSLSKSPYAIYSRSVSGIADQSLIINLPGSPKAVGEILEFLLPTIEHPLKLILNEIKDCQELPENQ